VSKIAPGAFIVSGLLALAAVLAVHQAPAADWPQFKRDAARTGNAPDEVLSFPMQRIVAVRFPAPIYASPAVVAGRVYIQDARGHVACVDSQGNRVVWTATIGGLNNASSPAVTHGRVFVGSAVGGLHVLDAATGREEKHVPAKDGVLAAPAVTERGVYVLSRGGQLQKLDFTGAVVWSYEPEQSKKSQGDARTGMLLEIAVLDDKISFHSGATTYLLQDLGDEARMLEGRGGRPVSGAALVRAAGTKFGLLSFRQLYGTWDGDFQGVKSPRGLDDTRATPSVRGDRVYRGDFCASQGGGVLWRADAADLCAGGFNSSPALARDTLVVGTELGHLHCLPMGEESTEGAAPARRAAAAVRKPTWTYEILPLACGRRPAISSSPAVADGKIFFGGEDGILYGLGQGLESAILDVGAAEDESGRTGAASRAGAHEWPSPGGDMGFSGVSEDPNVRPPFRIKWRTRVWGTFSGPMVVAGGRVFACGRNGQVIALNADTGEIDWRLWQGKGESRPSPSYAYGRLITMRARRGIFGAQNDQYGLRCLDAACGRTLWEKAIPFGWHFNNAGIPIWEGMCFAAWNAGPGVVKAAAFRLRDGTAVWERSFADLIPKDRDAPLIYSSATGEGKWFLSIAELTTANQPYGLIVRKNDIASEAPGVTLAFDGRTGAVVWRTEECATTNFTRVGYRKGTVVVVGRQGGVAIDPANGKVLWREPYEKHQKNYNWYYNAPSMPLSDAYLDSKGHRGLPPPIGGCRYVFHINGLWYGHARTHVPTIVAQQEAAPGNAEEPATYQTIWSQSFGSSACPAPVAAYGRLYYAPTAEGVVYCFEPVSATNAEKPEPE
jgi:outer membrane protein assembly factor BamB